MKREKARLEELRRMPLNEYLESPEWQETQKVALKWAENCCQVCKANNANLNTYHTTYDNLGCEQQGDVITLCETCYDRLYEKLAQRDDTPGEPEEETYPGFSFTKKAAVFVPSAIVGLGLPALLHAPLPAELFGFAAAIALAANSPKIYGEMKHALPAPLVELLDRMAERKREREAVGEWSNWDRLLGRHMHGNAPGRIQDDDGLAENAAAPGDEENVQEQRWQRDTELGTDEDELVPPPTRNDGSLLFSSVLQRFTPTLDHIYLAMTTDGLDIDCKAEDLCHVALAGNTGGGKTSIMRMLMAQLCKAHAQVLLLNPHYTRYDIKHDEDWTPFEPYLLYDPMECKKYEVIEHYLKHTVEVLLPKRLERHAKSLPYGKPYFIVMDELPAIVRHIKKAPDYMVEILEEGRKVGIFLICAAHDFLVKTIAPDSGGGSIRECYRTAYYVGGDATTARILLDTQANKIPEDQLGRGPTMLRCAAVSTVKKATLTRVPYVDNDALYRLLGPSTYQPSHGGVEPVAETLPQPVPTGNAKPHLELVRDEPHHHPGQTTEAPRRMAGIPRELREAAQVYQPGMTFHDLGRALQCSSTEARILWQELRKYHRVLERQASPYQLVANGGPSYQTTVEAPSDALPTAPGAKALRREQKIQLGKDVFLTQQQFAVALKLRKTGMSTGYRDLMPVFDLSEHHAKELNRQIRAALGQAPERESECESE